MGGVAEGTGKNGNDYSAAPVFIQYFGPAVNLTPLFGAGYNDWVPFLVLIVCVIFILNLHGKLLRLLSVKDYFNEPIQTSEHVEEGRQLLEQGII